MNDKRLLITLAAASMLVFGGCTTKNYVRQQTSPLVDHINQLDAETAKNTNAIKDVDQSAQAGLAAVNQSSEQAMTKAEAAQGQTQQVSQQLDQTGGQIRALDSTLANLDDYKLAGSNTVHFAFDKADLTPDSQQTLDAVSAQLQQNPHGILEVEGYTDSTGPVAYNETLSQRRADAVVRYLESKDIPAHRIYLIGLGMDQAVATNTTREGRQENRRVDLKIMVNGLATSATPSNQ